MTFVNILIVFLKRKENLYSDFTEIIIAFQKFSLIKKIQRDLLWNIYHHVHPKRILHLY